MLTRRMFLKAGAIAGAGVLVPWEMSNGSVFAAPPAHDEIEAIPGGTLDPTTIPKYVMPLVIPPAMPKTPRPGSGFDYYEIAVRQFKQQVLPTGLPVTKVWSYGSVNHPRTFNYPAFTIEAKVDKRTRVKWINQLTDAKGNYLPHLLPVDKTLHWANPGGGQAGRDSRPTFKSTPGPYKGPVPIVTHVHGAHTHEESDGYPEAWYLPDARNIPAGFARVGSLYQDFRSKFQKKFGVAWTPGSSVFQYPNKQRATTLWYHDHTLGITRLNVYAGPAGFYILRGGDQDLPADTLPGPAPKVGSDPFGTFYEIPLAIQDRSFNADGSLFFPDSREFFDGIAGPYIPTSDISPIWNPEFFGNTMLVNGRTWPVLNVEKRRYRFRMLNGCNSRFMILKMVTDPEAARPAAAALPFWQIGSEGGFLPAPVQLEEVLMGPAERADVIVDFTDVPEGTAIYLINEGPDEPFGGGTVGVDFDPSDPLTTGQVMKFQVVAATGPDNSTPAASLQLPAFTPLGPENGMRQLSLNEMMSMYPGFDGPSAAMLGTVENGAGVMKMWDDPITEKPSLGSTEIWEIHNFTGDAHPIHVHLVQFQVVNREVIGGAVRDPEAWEMGYKDTVIAYPDEITRIKAKFDKPGLFVWHCHIVDHEDNEMMRPYRVKP